MQPFVPPHPHCWETQRNGFPRSDPQKVPASIPSESSVTVLGLGHLSDANTFQAPWGTKIAKARWVAM